MRTTLKVILMIGLLFFSHVLGANVEPKKDCSKVEDLLDKLIGNKGVLEHILRDKAESEKGGVQSNSPLIGIVLGVGLGDILEIKLKPEIDSKLVSGILRDNELLESLLGSNGVVTSLVQELLAKKGSDKKNGTTSQNNQKDSKENILSRLLNSLGLLEQLKPQGLEPKGNGSLGGLSLDKVLSNDSIVNGLLQSLLGGDLLDSLLGEDSLLGCLLKRLVGKLINGNNSSDGKKVDKKQDSDKTLSLAENILLIQIINKLFGQQ